MSLHKWQISPEVRERYYGPAMFDPWAEWLVSGSPPNPGDCVVDLACATGAVTRQLARVVGENGSVVGSDISASMLEFASSLPEPPGAHIRWEQADMCDMRFASGSFDAVYCAQGLQFVPDRKAATKEIHRVLKPGGKLVASVFRSVEHNPPYRAVADSVKEATGVTIESSPYSLGDATELRNCFVTGGFERVEVMAHSMELTFPDPEMFLGTSTVVGMAGLPDLSAKSEDEQERLFEAVNSELRDRLNRFVEGDVVRFPTAVHRVVALK